MIIVQFRIDSKDVISLLNLNTFRPCVPNARVSAIVKLSFFFDRYNKLLLSKSKKEVSRLREVHVIFLHQITVRK